MAKKKVAKKATKKKAVKKKAVKKKAVKKTKKKAPIKREPECASVVPDKSLSRAGYSGIMALFLSILLVFMDTGSFTSMLQFVNYVVIGLLSGIFSILFMFGFVKIAKHVDNKLLAYTAYAFITLTVLDMLFLFSLITFKFPPNQYMATVFLIIYGLLAVLFGKAVFELRDKLGNIAKATGIMNIVTGILSMSIILAPIGILLSLVTEIFNIATMFRASKCFGK